MTYTIWNPDHLDKNWQNSTYVSEHGTDMYVDVYEVTYKHKHVCTWYVHVHKYIYICTYMFMNVYLCMYIVHTHT
jgi:hypothetical protein